MVIEYLGLNEINGPLVVLEGVKNAFYEEIVDIHLIDGSTKSQRYESCKIYDDKCCYPGFRRFR